MLNSSHSTDLLPSLSGKVALVTGGSRGIGEAIVRRLVRDGASVAFTYSASADAALSVSRETGARAIRADNADAEALEMAVTSTVDHFGGIDILVNNAGVSTSGDVESFSLAEFDRMFAINVRGVFAAVRAAVPHLSAGGRIIMIGTSNIDHVPAPGSSVYIMSKSAVTGFGRALARELGPRGITVNTVQPGPTDTEMNPASSPWAESLTQLIPVGRYGKTEDVASAVAYLASPEAGFVTGTSWAVDGGFSV